ncbi:MAG: RHS repeat protein, partial [bacterium]|nr:RHS repeat protein [bacterium]
FTYHANNLLHTIKDDKGNTTWYKYDDRKRLEKITYPDGTSIQFAFSEVTEGEKKYRLVTVTQRNDTVVINKYDELNRLVTRTISPGEGVLGTTSETYGYDALSRLTLASNNDWTITRGYDSLNRLTSETQGTKTVGYEYAVEGDHRTMKVTHPNGRVLTREFDVLDRLKKIEEAQQKVAEYSYIGRSYRLLNKQYGNNDAITYLYDLGRRLTKKETRNGTGVLINKYDYGYNKVHMKMYEQRGHDSDKGDVYKYDEFHRLTGVKFNS